MKGGIMAKNGNRTAVKISLGILVAGFAITISAIVWDAAHKSSNIEANRKDIDIIIPKVEINREACQEYKYKIDALNTKMAEMSNEQKVIRTEQQASFKEILKRLPENDP
jgi:acyl-CoA hydrolase